MEYKIRVKFLLFQIVLLVILLMIVTRIVRNTPEVRSIRLIEFTISSIIYIASYSIIDHYKKKALKKLNKQ